MSTEWVLRYIITIMARPTDTSAAATTITKNTKSWAEAASTRPASTHILEKSTSKIGGFWQVASVRFIIAKIVIAWCHKHVPKNIHSFLVLGIINLVLFGRVV